MAHRLQHSLAMASRPPSTEDTLEEPGTGRLLALSDGVVAIALTLLVLQLKVPDVTRANKTSPAALYHQLAHQFPQLLAYLISFYVIGVFWLVHHRVYRLMRGHHEDIAWWNFFFLFTITLFPFSAALMGAFPGNPLAVTEFAVNLLLASVSTSLTVTVAHRREELIDQATPELVRSMQARGAAAAVVIAISIVVALVAPRYAPFIWLFLAVSPRVSERWMARRPSDPAPGD